ncbi:MAG TPA: hypothetical protein VNP02_05835, partial [Gammaproteobacteria bacterium]|nr:hypothetical protein [Gammaproteobacteria bacterium]
MSRELLRPSWRSAHAVLLSLASFAVSVPAYAQPPPAPPDTRSARERAPIDLTGQWVAVVDEDWRWRMVTPPVGDTSSLPVNNRAREAAAAWDLERDKAEGNLCKAFAGPGLMRQPTRIRIEWEDDDTLRLEFDAGRQIRRLEFTPQAPGERALQGYSEAQWFRQTQSRGVFGQRTPPEGGSLVVRTTQLTGGYLRPNGVPFSERTTVKEFFNTFTLPGAAGAWLILTMVVDDPEYLTTELVVSSQFKK